MEYPKVSILVPIYNVEKYLPRCIESVLSQDFRDYELILVDDGSPDQCPQICDEYAKKDSRIKVVHKKNGGLVSARLAGFMEARGEYLMFLDSDDYLYPYAISCLYNKIIEGYDIVRGRHNKVSMTDELYGLEHFEFDEGELDADKYMKAYILGKVSPYLWGAIYKRSLFKEEIFRTFLFVSRQEDWVTQISIASNVNRVCYISNVVQAYMVNDSSIMQSSITDYSYVLKIEKALNKMTEGVSADIKRLLACDRVRELNRCFFLPELSFDWEVYKKVKTFLSDKENSKIVSAMAYKKLLRLIQFPLFFWAYTRLYNYFFKKKRLHGKMRKILK